MREQEPRQDTSGPGRSPDEGARSPGHPLSIGGVEWSGWPALPIAERLPAARERCTSVGRPAPDGRVSERGASRVTTSPPWPLPAGVSVTLRRDEAHVW